MVNRVTDSLTGLSGSSLIGHIGEVGAEWTTVVGNATPPVFDSTGGRVRANASGGQASFASGMATADGEYAEAVIDWVTVAGSVGLFTRAGNVGGVPRGYMAFLSGSQVTLMRLDNSTTFTTIVAAVAHVPSTGTHTYRITATGVGASVAIDVLFDGVLITSGADTSAGRVTAPASCGIYFDTTNSDSAGAHITSIVQEDPNASAAMALTIATPTAGAIAQRTGTTGTISASGTYTGSPTSIEARLVLDGTSTALTGFDWSTKVASPSGSTFAFSFAAVPENAWYNVQVRNSATPGTVVTSGKCGVGALVPLVGQSNAWLWFARGDSTLTPNSKLRVIGSGSDNGIASVNAAKNWAVPATASMNGAIAFGNRLATILNTLIGVIDVTWDGSGLTLSGNGGAWLPTTTAGQPYQRAKSFLNTITSKVEAVVVVNGETDGSNGVSQATFYAGMGTLISALRTDFGSSTTPIITALTGKRTDGLITDVNAEAIRNAQVQSAADTAIYRVERTDLSINADGVHLDAPGFTALGTRCAQALAYALGSVSYYRGPQISSVVLVDATHYDVLIAHGNGTDFTPTNGITGFRVLDGTTPIAVTAATHQTANRVRLTLASDPAAPPTIQYGYGTQPDVSAPLRDNSALSLPLEFNNGVVASEGSSFATTVTFSVVGPPPSYAAITDVTGLDYAFYDQPRISNSLAPVKKGTTLAISGGSATIDITGVTSLLPGQTGRIEWGDAAGTKRGGGQVVVS